MAHVLIVTLGPIQDFIEAARRTRDLWFGSWLLSELSKATARALAEECGIESLVFPGISKLSDLEPASSSLVANKIVVRVPEGKDAAQVAELGACAPESRGKGEALWQVGFGGFQNLLGAEDVEQGRSRPYEGGRGRSPSPLRSPLTRDASGVSSAQDRPASIRQRPSAVPAG